MKKIDLTKGNVLKVIVALALPVMGSSLLQFTYNLVDMLYVGHLGSYAVASIGSSSFYVGLGYSINSLVVIGTGIKVAQSAGKKDNISIKKYINSGILINLIIGIIYGITLICFGKNFIEFLNMNDVRVETNSYYYLAINGPILFFAFFNFLYSRIVGSLGNNKIAFKINAVGIVVNMILDPILIYTFKLGVIGAALGTLAANIIMFLLYLLKCSEIIKYDKNAKLEKEKTKEIIILGFPMAFQRILFTLINIILAKIIAMFGSDAIAAQKIGLQIESITYMVIGGLHGAISSFTGQNFGAEKYKRVKDGYSTSLKVGIIYSVVMAFIFMFLNEPIIRLFVTEDATVKIAGSYLKIVAFSQIFSTMETVSNGLFTGIGMPKIPSVISVVFTALRIPMAIILIKPFGINGVWISIALSSILKGIAAYSMYIMKVKYKFIEHR